MPLMPISDSAAVTCSSICGRMSASTFIIAFLSSVQKTWERAAGATDFLSAAHAALDKRTELPSTRRDVFQSGRPGGCAGHGDGCGARTMRSGRVVQDKLRIGRDAVLMQVQA